MNLSKLADRYPPHPRNPVWRTGLWTGAFLFLVMVLSIVLANHAPVLERFAFERNMLCYALFALVMALPLLRFGRSAPCVFTSGIIGWAIFSLGYWMAGQYLENLFARLSKTPLEVFVMGAVIYGIVAVAQWIAHTIHVSSASVETALPPSDDFHRS